MEIRKSRHLIGACVALWTSVATAGLAHAADGDLRIQLSPRLVNGQFGDMAVQLKIENPSFGAGEVVVDLPLVHVMAPSAVQDAAAITAYDAAGPLALEADVDPVDPTNFRQGRRWKASRASVGDVVVHYVATPREITLTTRPGPLVDMRTEGQGFHASGSIFLALPTEGWPRQVDLDWNLSAMGAGHRGVSSLGQGRLSGQYDRGDLTGSFFMAGPVISQPQSGEGPFVGYWLTPPVFDLQGALSKIEAAYADISSFFGDDTAPFKVFMRTTERFAGGGTGGRSSFIFGTVAGEVREDEELLGLLVHETLHNWLNGLGEATSQWWSEGSTSYYTEVMGYRTGITTLAQYQKGMNDLAKAYFLNPRSNLSSEEVTQLFFSDGDAQLVPYQRGPLYFAQLDGLIRERSNGTRRVDDLVRALLDARKSGGDYSQQGWIDLLRAELGEEGVQNFEDMMAGRLAELPTNMLGACFDRKATTFRRFYTGLRTEFDGRISRVIENTPAEAAGLLAGDRLVDPQALKKLEEAGPAEAVVQVVRDGQSLSVRFDPWGPERPGFVWERNAVPEERCGI